MYEPWECSDCMHKGVLNRHGRCTACGSNAVMAESVYAPRNVFREPINPRKKKEVKELERIFNINTGEKAP